MSRAAASVMWTLLGHLSLLLLMATLGYAAGETATELRLAVRHVASTRTSITVAWSDNAAQQNITTPTPPIYRLEAISLDTGVRLISPQMSANTTEYELRDLAVDSAYEMCIVSNLVEEQACEVYYTIPNVRDDSLIALFIALAVIAIIIIIAIILWRCALRQAASGAETDEPDEKAEDEAHGVNEKSPLLVPGSAGPAADAAGPQSATDPSGTQPAPGAANNQEQQPGSLYLFLAEHAFK